MADDKRWAVMYRRRGEQAIRPYTGLMTWKSAIQTAQRFNEHYGPDHVYTVEDYYDRSQQAGKRLMELINEIGAA